MHGPTTSVDSPMSTINSSGALKNDFQIDADHADRSSETTWRKRYADSHSPALAKALGLTVQQEAERIAEVVTLPAPPSPIRVTVTDPETGEQLDERVLQPGEYWVVTCRPAFEAVCIARGHVHTVTVSGVHADAEVAR